MLSGIGPADELRRHGIPVVADVAQVGQNLQNHPGVDVQWAADHTDSLTAEIGVIGQRPAGGRVGSAAPRAGCDELLRGRRLPSHQRRGRVPRHAVRVPRAHPQAGQRQAGAGAGFPVLDGLVPAAQPRAGEPALGGSRGPAVHRVQPSRRPARPDRPGRRHPADPRDRRPTGLDALQPGRALARTGCHQRRRAGGLRARQARNVVPPLRHGADGSRRGGSGRSAGPGSAPSPGCGWSTRRSCRRSSRPTSTHP